MIKLLFIPIKRLAPSLNLLALIVVILFACIKYKLFWNLGYATDMFLHESISRGLFWNRPIFWDNLYAPSSYIHSYFILIILSPLVFLTEVWGLLAVHLLLLILSFRSASRLIGAKASSFLERLAILVITLGPISFWIFDDPSYGWHSELLFFPLGVLFACALVNGSWDRFLWGSLLILNREDGAVLAAAISLFVAINSSEKIKIKKIAKILIFWGIIFILGLLLLKVYGDGAGYRQSKTLAQGKKMLEDPELRSTVLKMLWGTALLCLSGIIFLFTKPRLKVFLSLFICLLPVIGITTLASFAYLPKINSILYHGTSWPYRFGMLWALITIAAIYSLKGHYLKPSVLVIFIVSSLLLQYYLLIYVRDYHLNYRLKVAISHTQKINTREAVFLSCLSEKLPSQTPLIVSGALTAYFHSHDWTYGRNYKNAWNEPTLCICDKGNLGHENLCRSAQDELLASDKNWKAVKIESLNISFKRNKKAKYKKVIAYCKSEINPARIIFEREATK